MDLKTGEINLLKLIPRQRARLKSELYLVLNPYIIVEEKTLPEAMMKKEFNPFDKMKFDVEHALNIYATTYATFHVSHLYKEGVLDGIKNMKRAFHIYLVGYIPKTKDGTITAENGVLTLPTSFSGNEFALKFPYPQNWQFRNEKDDICLIDEKGERRWINDSDKLTALSQAAGGFPFTVKYVGQAYGNDGSRDAIDRLKKHETVQQILALGIPDDVDLQVLLLEVQTDNRVITAFFPNSEFKDDDGARRKNGLDKLFDTSDAERISLYEAALIHYFSPEFNKAFKNSFPSTNLKVLHDCYEKDFLALISEICFQGAMPFYLCSEVIKPQMDHIIRNDLQNDAARKMFFSV